MTEISIKLSEMTDSREVMESKPYPMVVYFIYIIVGILSIALTWAYFSEIDIVVKGSGMVRPNEGISVVNNKLTGRIAETNLEEGLEVEKGDLLFTILHEDLKATQELISNELVVKEVKLSNLNTYKDSILKRENLFDVENPLQKEYYFKYMGFTGDLVGSKENIVSNQSSLKNMKSKLEGMLTLKSSLDVGTNMFTNTKDLYALKYSEFVLKKEELSQNLLDNTEKFEANEILYENGVVSKSDYKTVKTQYLQSKLASEQFEVSFYASLENDIEEASLQIQKLSAEMKSLSPNAYAEGVNYLPVETKTIIDIDNQIVSAKQEINSLKENLTKIEFEIEKCIILAETDGVVNLKKRIAIGDYIGAGDNIATIIPSENPEYTIQISMPERDISTVEVGDSIKYQFHALPYREYGELNGKVTKISVDSTINEEAGINYFVLEADVENKPLYSYKGERADLKVGMMCEAQVITKSKKVLFFLLEKIDLWD